MGVAPRGRLLDSRRSTPASRFPEPGSGGSTSIEAVTGLSLVPALPGLTPFELDLLIGVTGFDDISDVFREIPGQRQANRTML